MFISSKYPNRFATSEVTFCFTWYVTVGRTFWTGDNQGGVGALFWKDPLPLYVREGFPWSRSKRQGRFLYKVYRYVYQNSTN